MELESIRRAIKEEEALLAQFDRERQNVLDRLQVLHTQLRNALPTDTLAPEKHSLPGITPATADEKVTLFRDLFRGREDVYPKFWRNEKTGRSGYSPACANEWVRGVCEKPRVKCGECPSRSFLPVTDQVILDHLQGRHVIGVYPLLPDESCRFLAVDFDKLSWQEDVAAFLETCRADGIAACLERSRSGNGAHVWFFFEDPVPATVARKMGCFLITETMDRRHQLAMESYDRLFPNQDTMPAGGFGNLIALPLQSGPRKDWNTVFLDEHFNVYPDQWGYLASIRRTPSSQVQSIADEAIRNDRVIGVPMCFSNEEESTAPWLRSPSLKHPRLVIDGPLPAKVHGVIAQRLFVEKRGLPAVLLNRIKRLAAFQNPEFYKKQSMRFSTAATPRVICCAEDLPEHVALPRGTRDDLAELLSEHGIALKVSDERNEGELLDLRFQGRLTSLQEQAVSAMLAHDLGVFVAPPGSGKTVAGAYLISARNRSTLVLVHRKPLLDQWVAQLALFLGIDAKSIGRIGGGKNSPTGRLDVAMIQSLGRLGEVDDLVTCYGHVVVDECHHLSAVSFERVLGEVKARYVTGLTATPYRRDGHQPIIHMQCGPVRFAVSARRHESLDQWVHRLIVRETGFNTGRPDHKPGIQDLYALLAADEERNGLIFDDVMRALEEGRSPVLLTERKDHLDLLAEKMRKFARHIIVLKGGMKRRELRETMEHLAAIPEDEERLILATGRYIGEGFDDARLDTLFLALPVSWKGTLVQYAGRLHRLHPEKREARIYDYVDRNVPMLARMFEKRLRGYRTIGYSE